MPDTAAIARVLKERRANYTDHNASDGTCDALAAWIADLLHAPPLTDANIEYLLKLLAAQRRTWTDRVEHWVSHDAIIKRDYCAAQVAEIDAMSDRLQRQSSGRHPEER